MSKDTKVLGISTNSALLEISMLLNSLGPIKVQKLIETLSGAVKHNPTLTIEILDDTPLQLRFEVQRSALEVAKEELAEKMAAVKRTEKTLKAYKKEIRQLTETITAIEDSNLGQ
jgi:hypothetical protein